jgi:hypothetical protein
MRASVLAATIAVLTILFAGTSAALADTQTYYCGEGTGNITVAYNQLGSRHATVTVNLGDGVFDLRMTGGGDGEDGYVYSSDEFSVSFNGNQDTLTYSAPDYGTIDCFADSQPPEQDYGTNTVFPVQGRSCGGILRAGPDGSYAKLASLYEGQPIMILEQAGGPDADGYVWFKIRADGRIGYSWGGILSVAQGDLPGSYVGC